MNHNYADQADHDFSSPMWKTYMEVRFGVDHQTEVCVEVHGREIQVCLHRWVPWIFKDLDYKIHIPLTADAYGFRANVVQVGLDDFNLKLAALLKESVQRRWQILGPMYFGPMFPDSVIKLTGLV